MSDRNLNFVDVDSVLSFSGDFGIYQYYLIALFSFINILSAYHYFGQTFIALTPDFECMNKTLNHTSDNCYLYYQNENDTIKERCQEWNYKYDYNYTTIVDEVGEIVYYFFISFL